MINISKQHSLTLFLLCLGYFIDFYDLSIMGASYSELLKEQFNITTTTQIQQTYLLISNFQTIGIFIGAILFGILGDKIGRARAIRYSILLYSITTLLAVYTHSLPFFIFLRFLTYIGLATEFSTSTVLILELFSIKSAAWGSALLYSFGVLGGILATSISFFSWKAMFLFGGSVGLLLFIGRSQIQESEVYLYAKKTEISNKFGNIFLLIRNKIYMLKLLRYLLMTVPYFALISMMFIFPNYIIEKETLGHATNILLLGFFCGNILSSLLSALFIQYNEDYKRFVFLGLCLFVVLVPIFFLIPEDFLFLYSMGLGLIGGGYPILITQQAGRDYPIHIRSLACNTLFALGRASYLIFNILMSYWLTSPDTFVSHAILTTFIVFGAAMLSLWCSHKNLS